MATKTKEQTPILSINGSLELSVEIETWLKRQFTLSLTEQERASLLVSLRATLKKPEALLIALCAGILAWEDYDKTSFLSMLGEASSKD